MTIEAAPYFSNQYCSDLEIFKDASNTSSLDLCPLTLEVHLRSNRFQEIVFPDSFFACQYCLNLIAQAVHSYFTDTEFGNIDYLDVQGCNSHSFRAGMFSRPIDLIHFLSAHGIHISTGMLNEYTHYFVTQVLPEYSPDILVSDFCGKLLTDMDCIEIHPILRAIANETESGELNENW